MRVPISFLFAILTSQVALGRPAKRSYDTHHYYVIQHDPFSSVSLAEVARALGVELVEQAGELKDHWLVRTERPPLSSISPREEPSNPVIDTFTKLQKLASSQPSTLSSRSEEVAYADLITSAVKHLSHQTLRKRTKRAPPPIRPPSSDQPPQSSKAISDRLDIHDPLFSEQWHLVNDEYPEHMMNVTPVWEMGITGKGIISSLVDDGLDYTSEDLADNFDAADSYDFNDHVDLPTPKLYDDHHGTRCAGQVAAGKNTVCGMGIAYESKVAGVRILSGPISDVDEAAALNYGYQNVSIYSCSWGPPDNGQSMEGPGYLIKKAVVNGINDGRGGKGSIFVFASGNGAAHSDQCNFDGYTNSIYSVTVSAVDHKGLHPYYSEPCAANMIVAYSSGGGRSIVTTDTGKNACSKSHGGTSAAAPNAVGVFALALEARPDLTWRDIQHLCVETARMISPEDADWEKTATGRPYSYKYGFGVLDASLYVQAAQSWTLVKPQAWLETPTIQLENGTMDADNNYSGGQFIAPGGVASVMTITKEMLTQFNLEKLEHINIKVWINHKKRGDVSVDITSPNGIKSILGAPRSADSDSSGYPGWTFMSVKHWGEDPVGDWKISVSDSGDHENSNGTFLGWNMILWGSAIDPAGATKLDLVDLPNILPPPPVKPPTQITPSASATKSHPKPTDHLPGDHGTAEGENDKPAFSKPTSDPTPDEGWFSDMSNLVSSPKWVFGALGAVAVFGISAGLFFWRRRVIRQRMMGYATISTGENVGMSTLGESSHPSTGAPRTKELYDAFGEVSDDDEDADEETHLRGQSRSPGGLGFHEGFLDDDDEADEGASPGYRDRPIPGHHVAGSSPTPSGDGSWEHAA